MVHQVDGCVVAVICTLALMGGLIMWYVPPDMDMYSHFHALACLVHPNSYYHTFREPCDGKLDLTVLNFWPWTRAFAYIGATYSILYYPIYLLWPDWRSVPLLDVLIMVPGVVAAWRLLKVDFCVALLALCVTFPIMSYAVRNYGQLTVQLTVMYLVPWLAWKAITTERGFTRTCLSLAAGFLLAVGVESKPVLLYFVPSMAIVTAAACWTRRPAIGVVWLMFTRLWHGLLLCTLLLLLLFTAQDNDGSSYWHDLTSMVPPAHTPWETLIHARDMVMDYWFNFPNVLNVTYGDGHGQMSVPFPFRLQEFLLTMPFWVVTAVALWFYIVRRRQFATDEMQHQPLFWGLLLASVVGVLVVGEDLHSSNPHHILQAFYLFLGALAIALHTLRKHDPRIFAWLAGGLMASQIACTAYVISKTPLPKHEWQHMEALDFIRQHRLAEKGVVDHLDWGTYYISALYAPREQIVLFQAPSDYAIRLAQRLRRRVVFVKMHGDDPHFPAPIRRVYPGPGRQGPWEVWTDAPVK